MSDLIGRVARVTCVRQPDGFIGTHPQYFEKLQTNAIVIEKFHITFQVTKHLGKEPNKATIKIYGLSERTRIELEKRPTQVTLHAGYESSGARPLFSGDLIRGFSQREGKADIVTTLQVADGMRAFAHARVNKSYKPPIEVRRVLADAAKSMGLSLPPEVDQSAELRQALDSGISMHGPTRDVLTRLLAQYGYSWSIQSGKLQILKDGQLKNPNDAFLINLEKGLINRPERTTPEKPGGKSEVKFDVLLYPELYPGAGAKLESEFLNLTVKMTDLDISGDNKVGDWKTSVTGRPA